VVPCLRRRHDTYIPVSSQCGTPHANFFCDQLREGKKDANETREANFSGVETTDRSEATLLRYETGIKIIARQIKKQTLHWLQQKSPRKHGPAKTLAREMGTEICAKNNGGGRIASVTPVAGF